MVKGAGKGPNVGGGIPLVTTQAGGGDVVAEKKTGGATQLPAFLAELPPKTALAKSPLNTFDAALRLGEQAYADPDVGTEQTKATVFSFFVDSKIKVPPLDRWKKHDARVAQYLRHLGVDGTAALESLAGDPSKLEKADFTEATEALGLLVELLADQPRAGADKLVHFAGENQSRFELLSSNGFSTLLSRLNTAHKLAS